MHARVTKYKMKADRFDDAKAFMESVKGEILAMPGMKHFINVANDDGSGYVVALVESREISEANADKVKAMWGRFGEYLEAMPTPEGYEVIADWPA